MKQNTKVRTSTATMILTPLQQRALEWVLEKRRVETCTQEEATGRVSTASSCPSMFKKSLKMAILNSRDAGQKIGRWEAQYLAELDKQYGTHEGPDTYPMGMN